MIMHALSVKQSFASLIARGRKTKETRTWKTKYRGDLLICACFSSLFIGKIAAMPARAKEKK